jgi:hypothetical protein
MAKSLSAFVGLLMGGFLAGVAIADTAPSWRGDPGTTFQQWDFTGNSLTPAPNLLTNSYGTPTATINYNPPFGTGWYNTLAGYGSQVGFWDIANGSIGLNIPSVAVPAFYLQIQLQVVYWRDISQAPTFSLLPSGVQIGSTITTLFEDPAGIGAWYSDLVVWEVTPGPSDQFITILGDPTFGSVIGQVIVDTRPVPEPAAGVLMLLGVAGLLWRRGSRYSG